MEGTEITGVNGPREANQVTVSIDSEVSFQVQLEEIDNDLAKFETLGGSVEEGPANMYPLGINGPGQMS